MFSVTKHMHCRGRSHVHKTALLATTQDVSDWNRTLKLGQKAKDMGIILFVNARFGDQEDEAKFQQLAFTPNLAFFANNEREHMRIMRAILDQKLECEYIFDHPKW